jgi:hypothetical protein
MRSSTVCRTRWSILVPLMLLALAPAANAQTGKVVEVEIEGTAIAGRTVAFDLTLTNPVGAKQQVGSANVTPPFPLISPTGRNGTVELRNLDLKAGEFHPVTITAQVPCSYDGTGAWAIQAKQSNNFNGPPGNNVTAIGDLTTSVTGACSLAFGTPPADAEVGAVITGTPYDPTGLPVTVVVKDGAGEPTGAAVPVTMSLAPGSGLGTLSGTVSAVTSAGVATFDDLTITSRGLYSLQASSPEIASAFSAVFRIDPPGVECVEDEPCEDTATTGRSSLKLLGVPNTDTDAGRLFLSFGEGLVIDCAGYDELTADTAVFDVTGDREKVTTMTIDKKTMATVPNNGASFLQVCFAAPDDEFETRSGDPVLDDQTFDWDGDGVAEPVYKGLLQDCGAAAPPCVSKRQKTGSGDGVIQALLPAGDPAMRH